MGSVAKSSFPTMERWHKYDILKEKVAFIEGNLDLMTFPSYFMLSLTFFELNRIIDDFDRFCIYV